MHCLSKLWAYNIALKKETVKGVWQRARKGPHQLFDGQLTRKCANDWVLCWIMGPGITPGVLRVVLLFEHRHNYRPQGDATKALIKGFIYTPLSFGN